MGYSRIFWNKVLEQIGCSLFLACLWCSSLEAQGEQWEEWQAGGGFASPTGFVCLQWQPRAEGMACLKRSANGSHARTLHDILISCLLQALKLFCQNCRRAGGVGAKATVFGTPKHPPLRVARTCTPPRTRSLLWPRSLLPAHAQISFPVVSSLCFLLVFLPLARYSCPPCIPPGSLS